MVQSGYKFRTGLASNYIVYRGLQINYFRIQKKGPFLSECVEICYKIKSFSQNSKPCRINLIETSYGRLSAGDRTGSAQPDRA